MRDLLAKVLLALLFMACVGTTSKVAESSQKTPFPDIPRITTEELKSMLGDENVIILDVRVEKQWELSPQKIPGAIHENAKEVKSWAGKYPKDKTIVLYCA